MLKNCYDAEYVTRMSQIQQDELFSYQIFASNNCEYILIRNPSSILSFYSVSHESIIQKWNINNNSIWSIYTSTDPQEMTLSNTGCLTWSTEHESMLTEICSINQSLIFTTNTNNSQSVFSIEIQRYSLQQLLNQQIIWIPISLCIVGAFCIILCFCITKIFGNKHFNHQKLSPIEEETNGSSTSSRIFIPSDEENDNKEKQNYLSLEEDNVNFKSISQYPYDPRDNELKSPDSRVAIGVISVPILSRQHTQLSDISPLSDAGLAVRKFEVQDIYVPMDMGSRNQSQQSDTSALDLDNADFLTIPELNRLSVVYSIDSNIQEM